MFEFIGFVKEDYKHEHESLPCNATNLGSSLSTQFNSLQSATKSSYTVIVCR